MNIKVTPYHFEQLLKDGYTLDMIFLLKLIDEEFDIKTLAEGGAKTDMICQILRRKGLVSEQFKITVLGRNLLEFMNTRAKTSKIVKKTQTFAEFERWWAAYPVDSGQFRGRGVKAAVGGKFLAGRGPVSPSGQKRWPLWMWRTNAEETSMRATKSRISAATLGLILAASSISLSRTPSRAHSSATAVIWVALNAWS
jgi:hypothetical protein